uniref:Uncharacterized protein n=1 Tax=Anguilla anguilla TaxID=7936 RepID=A0A0E9QPS6_ANGAN
MGNELGTYPGGCGFGHMDRCSFWPCIRHTTSVTPTVFGAAYYSFLLLILNGTLPIGSFLYHCCYLLLYY